LQLFGEPKAVTYGGWTAGGAGTSKATQGGPLLRFHTCSLLGPATLMQHTA